MFYYAISITLSAFLLFQIQPIISKYILPWFGGTPAVWSSSMLFFQVLLLGGYAYAYGLVDRLPYPKQARLHLGVLGLSLALLLAAGLAWDSPITPGIGWRPAGVDQPVWDIFKVLAVSVGLPYFVLSTNSPLMQAWFSHTHPGRSPYRLYALSNLGSLLSLVTYPILVEPLISLFGQGRLWAAGFVLYSLAAGYGALRLLRLGPAAGSGSRAAAAAGVPAEAPPSLGRQALWLALAACASVMLLATTSQMTQEVAVIPFLWVLPLTLYLLSFIFTFDSERWYSRPVFTAALFVCTALYFWLLLQGVILNYVLQIGAYSLILFVVCMISHGELARLKPHPRYLTTFYLMMAAGGALGGIAVNLIAPYIFNGYWEYQVGLFACWALLLIVGLVYPQPGKSLAYRRLSAVQMLVSVLVVGGVLFWYVNLFSDVSTRASRNFYGVLRVLTSTEGDPKVTLSHGATSHGWQYRQADKRSMPTAYFSENSGVGLALRLHERPNGSLRVGVLGLGVGTLAAYGQPGDVFRFYEINPEVIHLAQGKGDYFTYLADSPAEISVQAGDARIVLERELASGQAGNFDVLVLDTFNSDSIPVHLLTRQAFDVYLAHLRPGGVIAAHITNNHLDLVPIVWTLADHLGLQAVLIETQAEGERQSASTWMLLSADPGHFQQAEIAARAAPRPEMPAYRLWTDDYSNLFQILK